MSPKLRVAVSIALKEARHILRDPLTMAMALGMPVILVTLFGFIIDFHYKDISISLFDHDSTPASRSFTRSLGAAGYFRLLTAQGIQDPEQALAENKSFASLILNPGFGRDLNNPSAKPSVQLLLDGSDNSKTGIAMGYFQKASALALSAARGERPPLENAPFQTRFLFNHELNSRWFIIPGLTVVICGLIGILLTALTVAREWENGSMEMLLSTPARPGAIIAGKLAPYLALGFCGVVFVYAAARLVFGVPFCGSHALYALSCTLFLLAATAQGLFISIVTRQQQLAMQFAIVSGLLPSLLLSGFVFPVSSMPVFFQYFTCILPPRWFMETSRGIFLKGAGVADLWPQLLMQALLCAVLITLALKKFKTDLEP